MNKNNYTNPSKFAATNGLAYTDADILKAIDIAHSVFARTKGNGWSEDDLNDLYQDTVLKVYRYLPSYDPGKAQLHTWVSMIARCCQNDALRTRYGSRKFVYWDDLSSQGETDNPDDADCDSCWEIAAGREYDPSLVAELNDALGNIEEAISSLSNEDYASVLQLTLDGLKPREIADLMGIPAKDVSTILCRAKKSVRERLSGEIYENLNLAA